MRQELSALIASLKEHPEQGTQLANHCFKIRLAIASKGKGKSGGARIITHLAVRDRTVYLLSIYDKSEHASLADRELDELLKYLPG